MPTSLSVCATRRRAREWEGGAGGGGGGVSWPAQALGGQAGRLGAADTKCTHVGVQCPWPAAYNGRRSVTIAWMSVVVKRFFMAAAVPSTG